MKPWIVFPLLAGAGLVAWPYLLQLRMESAADGLMGTVFWILLGFVLALGFLAGIVLLPLAFLLKKILNFPRYGLLAFFLIAVPIYFSSIYWQSNRLVSSQHEENKRRAEPLIQAVMAYKEATNVYPPDLETLVRKSISRNCRSSGWETPSIPTFTGHGVMAGHS